MRGEFDQHVAARFCSGGASAQRQAQAAACVWVASPAGPAWQHAPDLDMFAHWLPNDAKLNATQLLCDDTELRERALPDVVRALVGDTARLLSHQCELVQLVPELRACARVTLQLQHRLGGDSTTHTLFAKADRARDGAQSHAAMLALHRSPAQSGGHLRTPRPLLWQPSTGLHWQWALPGMTLEAQLDAQTNAKSNAQKQPLISTEVAGNVGRHLAALHGTALLGGVPVVTLASLQASINKACDVLGLLDAAWRAPLQRLQAALTSQLQQQGHALMQHTVATLHGDLHPGNILVHAGHLAFIDLDDLRSGPAVFELGAWVAYTLSRAVLRGAALQPAAPPCHAFLAAYAQARGQTRDQAADATWLAWSTAHHLLCRRACGGLATLKPGRYAAVPRLLALADAISQAQHIDVAFAPLLAAA
jgi:thiamine kinase-like enzyme